MRVRVRKLSPSEPTRIVWRAGGEGLGGTFKTGAFPTEKGGHTATLCRPEEWSAWIKVDQVLPAHDRPVFMTLTAGRAGRPVAKESKRRVNQSMDVVIGVEFRHGANVYRIEDVGPRGGTVTIGLESISGNGVVMRPLKDYASSRLKDLMSAAWSKERTPEKYLIVADVLGYGDGYGHGVHSTDDSVAHIELSSVRQLGANGLRGAPPFMQEALLLEGTEPFRRGAIEGPVGYPVPRARARHTDDQAGCPFRDDAESRRRELYDRWLEAARRLRVEEVWLLTVDEIATIFDVSHEGKRHVATCPRCAVEFRTWLRQKGNAPADFGAADWSAVRPLDVWQDTRRAWEANPRLGRLAYESLEFLNYGTIQTFTPLRDACRRHNDGKRAKASKDPWIISYSLRGNTFIRSGHSLDYFDFYRGADNAIVYETSHRDGRTWQWDAYMCDLQRVVARREGVKQGIYVKPHRGAVVQRTLTAAGRGATMVYWYTYGPDYAKGDSFAARPDVLLQTSWATRLLARAESLLYGSRLVEEPKVALFRSDVTQRWWKLRANPVEQELTWEESKWLYTLLSHEHVALDPLADTALVEDASRYRVIYVVGSHMTRRAAVALERFVGEGGTVVVVAGSATRDEGNEALTSLLPVLGLRARMPLDVWTRAGVAGAGELPSLPESVRLRKDVRASVQLDGVAQLLSVAREPLAPAAATSLAKFDDGKVAMTRHAFGKGIAYTFGFFPGLEYSWPIRGDGWVLNRDYDAMRRHAAAQVALEQARPTVSTSHPLVEGVLLENPSTHQRGVTLCNWSFAAAQGDKRFHATTEAIHSLRVDVRGAGRVTRARSLSTNTQMRVAANGDSVTFTLPLLHDGDVVALDS